MKQTSYRKILQFMQLRKMVFILLVTVGISACNKRALKIQQNFPFDVEVMPVPKEVANAQKVEIRFKIVRSGNYGNTHYFIRYFQFDGKGKLQYGDKLPYGPNDLYPLPSEQFTLYYTSASSVSQNFDVWISDNFGNEKQLSFEFNSSN